ncbi:CidA/LrgA family protein [Alkalimarinus coralli]|uniref:CidA/LrgA family protein n=1 Tax=Alkalimarinus coralli TaxID=2935863 RepID=UPI00202B8024|nr:CidA/LrgA family protein [Alkalimarinus coralli]
MLPSLTLIILFQLAGTFVQQHFNSPIPGAVIGMILFFLYLCLAGGSNEKLQETGSRLLKHLPLLFIPAGVGILVYTEELRTQGIAIVASLTLGSLIAFVITLLIFKKLTAIQNTTRAHND